MRCFRYVWLYLLLTLLGRPGAAQNTSNKGTDFWTGYMAHIDGTSSNMSLYITSDVSTSGTVSIPGKSWSTNFNITANNITVVSIPQSLAYMGCSDCVLNQGIHITSQEPVVVFAHIYANSRSDATLVLPTETAGRDYYAMSFTQKSTGNGRQNEFMIVGLEDSTYVDITPAAGTLSGTHAKGVTYSKLLMQGQVYQIQSDSDLTTSRIVSYGTGNNGCKRIAVFSGSSFNPLGCASAGTGDNLFQQMYPVSAWGKNYVTAPMKTRLGGDYFRALAGTNNTKITINGWNTQTLQAGQYYEWITDSPQYITSNYGICLAQFQRTQSCDNVTGDPSMVILNSTEQQLNDITLYSSPYQNITGNYINVYMQSSDTAGFWIDNVKPSWKTVPSNAAWAYAQQTVASGNHHLYADSFFNAIAYGFGNVESYSYSAGANIKNQNQEIQLKYGTSASTCKGQPVYFKGVCTYTPYSWKWYFGDGSTDTIQNPVHTYADTGYYTVSLVTVKSNGNDCESKDSTVYKVHIYKLPIPAIRYGTACSNEQVSFYDSTNVSPYTISNVKWDFGDGTISTSKNPKHQFSSYGTWKIKLSVTSTGNCTSTDSINLNVNASPAVRLKLTDSCITGGIGCFDSTTLAGTFKSGYACSKITVDWNDGTMDTFSNYIGNKNYSHQYTQGSNYNIYLKVIDCATGCKDSSTLTISLEDRTNPNFKVTAGCEKDSVLITDSSYITFGNITSRKYNFGDGKTASYSYNPGTFKKLYSIYGNYNIQLITSNKNGCNDTIIKQVNIYPKPKPGFVAQTVCKGDTTILRDTSTIPSGSISTIHWYFGDGKDTMVPAGTTIRRVYDNSGNYTVKLVTQSALGCADSITKTVSVDPKPKAQFTLVSGCQYDSIVFKDNSSGTNITSRKWNIGTDSFSNFGTNFKRYFSDTGLYNIKLQITTTAGCSDSVSGSLNIYAKPSALFTGAHVCLGDTTKLNDISTSPGSNITKWRMFWATGDSSVSTIKPTSLKKKFFAAGAYQNCLLVETNHGCRDTFCQSNMVYKLPKAGLSVSGNCMNDTIRFSMGFIRGDTGLNYYIFQNGDGYKDSGQTAGNIQWYYAKKGNFNTSLLLIDSNGCRDSVNYLLKTDTVPVPSFIYIPQCAGDSVRFTDSSYMKSGSLQQIQINWGDSVQGIGLALSKIAHVYHTGGYKNIIWKATSSAGCSDSISKTIYVLPKPAAAFTIPNICFKDSVYFKDLTSLDSGSIVSRLFRFGDGDSTLYTGYNSYAHKYAMPGTYPISLVTISDKGCKDSVAVAFTVNSSPVAAIGMASPCLNAATLLTDSSSIATGKVYKWKWLVSDGSTDTLSQWNHLFPDTGVYKITLKVESGNLCKDSVSRNIRIYAKPKANFTVNNVCEYDSIRVLPFSTDPKGAIDSTFWKFSSTDSTGTPGNVSVTHRYPSPGNFQILQIAKSNWGCFDTLQKPISIFPKPISNYTFSNICAYDSLAIQYIFSCRSDTVKNRRIYWGNGDSLSLAKDSGIIKYSYTSAGNYQLTTILRSNHACMDTSSQTVWVHAVPQANIYSPDTEQCFRGNQFTLTDSTIWNFGKYNRTWTWNADTAAQIQINYNVPGNYNISLLLRSDSGCADTAQLGIHIWPNPVAAIYIRQDTFCFKGHQCSLTDSSTLLLGSLTRKIYWGDGQTDTGLVSNHTYGNYGNKTIQLISFSDQQCTDTALKSVIIFPSPTAGFYTNGNCPGDSSFMTDTSTMIGSVITKTRWDWGDGDSTLGTVAPMNRKHLYTSPGVYHIQYSIENASGCSDQYTDSIQIYKIPVPQLKVQEVCAYDSLKITDQSTTPGSSFGKSVIQWGDGTTDSFSQKNIYKHLYATSGQYPITYKIYSGQGCIDSASTKAWIFPIPRAGFAGGSVCEQQKLLFKDTSNLDSGQIIKRFWDWGDLTNTITSGADTSHRWNQHGSYLVTLVVTSDRQCTDTVSDSVKVHQLPVAVLQTSDTCMNDSLVLRDIGYSYGDPIQYRIWQCGDGNQMFDSSGNLSRKYKYASFGLYTLQLKVITTAGCADSSAAKVYIKPSPYITLIPNEVCLGDSSTLKWSTRIDSGLVSQYRLNWGDGNYAGFNSGPDSASHLYLHDSDYMVSLEVTSDLGCSTKAQVPLIVHPLPLAGYSTNKKVGCEPLAVKFFDVSTIKRDSITARRWDFGDGQTDDRKFTQNIYLNEGLYQPKLWVITDAGCTDFFEDSVPIIVHEKPIANFECTYPLSTTLSPEAHFVNTSRSAESWIWHLGDGIISTEKNPYHVYQDTGIFQVMQVAINHYGCKDTVIKPYQVIPSYTLFLVNSFTPNGDDLNDTWGPDGMPVGFRNYKLSIYNRWGELIFESENPLYRWNGNYMNTGKVCASEVYIYRMDFTDYQYRKHNKQGTVLLLR